MGELADKLRYAMQDGTIRTEILGTANPVSYTHLDVYKRQALMSPSERTRSL